MCHTAADRMAAGNQQRHSGASVSAIYSGGSGCILHSLPVPNSELEPLLGLEPTIGSHDKVTLAALF